MNKLVKATAVDDDKVKNGVEVTFTTDGVDKFRVTILPSGSLNPKLQKRFEEVSRPFRRAGKDLEELSPEVNRKLTAQVFSECVIVHWNTDDFGEEYTVEAGERTMIASPSFADFIVNEAKRQANFKAQAIGTTSGN